LSLSPPFPVDFTKIGTQVDPPRLSFIHNVGLVNTSTNLRVRLTTSAGNYFEATIPNAGANAPVTISLTCGPFSASTGATDIPWIKTGAPNWNNIISITFIADTGLLNTTGFIDIDGLVISGTLIETAVDGRTGKGESKWGRRSLRMLYPLTVDVTGGITTGAVLGARFGLREAAFNFLKLYRDPIFTGHMFVDASA